VNIASVVDTNNFENTMTSSEVNMRLIGGIF
jgi:hypothetical protein